MAEVITRTLVLDGEETEISLETGFWDALMRIADVQRKSVVAVIEDISDNTHDDSLSSAIRLFVLDHYRRRKQR
jgi:predicted DNA-binding ribbon-helix-helix protein